MVDRRPERQFAEVLFEFKRIGNVMRVTAIDPETNTEVTFIAPPRTSRSVLQRLGVAKLRYVLDGPRHVNIEV